MKQRKNFQKALAVLLAVWLIAISFAPAALALDESLLMKNFYVSSQSTYNLIGGVKEKQYVINDKSSDTKMNVFAMEVDLGDPNLSIIAGYNDGDADEWARATVMNQAKAMEAKRGVNVIGAVNADFYRHSDGFSAGPLIMNGVVCNSSGSPYFAILKDGTAAIRSGGTPTDDVKEAVGGNIILIKNGKIVCDIMDTREPRTAVGIKADGTVVLFVANGRQVPASYGMYYDEIAHTMLSMGCVEALNLDGGGSSTFVTQREGLGELSVKNSPCYVAERPVSSTLMVCCSAKPSGIFDHVAFDESYYDVATNDFAYIDYLGIDTNGFGIKTPAGGKLVLSDDSLGKISGNTFYSNSKEGDLTITYEIDGVAYGSTLVNVSKENDRVSVKIFKSILQLISTLKQLMQFVFQKIAGGADLS